MVKASSGIAGPYRKYNPFYTTRSEQTTHTLEAPSLFGHPDSDGSCCGYLVLVAVGEVQWEGAGCGLFEFPFSVGFGPVVLRDRGPRLPRWVWLDLPSMYGMV